MTYGCETRPLLVDVGLNFKGAEMQMIRWMCGISLKDRMTSVELRRLVGVKPSTTVIRRSGLRWYGHVMRSVWKKWSLELKAEDQNGIVRECRCGYGRTLDRQRRCP